MKGLSYTHPSLHTQHTRGSVTKRLRPTATAPTNHIHTVTGNTAAPGLVRHRSCSPAEPEKHPIAG